MATIDLNLYVYRLYVIEENLLPYVYQGKSAKDRLINSIEKISHFLGKRDLGIQKLELNIALNMEAWKIFLTGKCNNK